MRNASARRLLVYLAGLLAIVALFVFVARQPRPEPGPGAPYTIRRSRLGTPYAGTGVLPGQGAPGPGYPGDTTLPQVQRGAPGTPGAPDTSGIAELAGIAGPADLPANLGGVPQPDAPPLQQIMRRERGVLQIILTDRGIRPPQIRIRVGSRVRLHVINRGGQVHNLVLPDFGVTSPDLAPGAATDVEIYADKPGRYPYYSDARRLNVADNRLQGFVQVVD
jgi:hypothetical protein